MWQGGCAGQRVQSSWGCVLRGSTEQDGHLGAALESPGGESTGNAAEAADSRPALQQLLSVQRALVLRNRGLLCAGGNFMSFKKP